MTRPEPMLVQAPVKALDEDGVAVAVISTVAFAVASVVAWINVGALSAGGHRWWLWVAVSGTVIGIGFTAYCLIRRARNKARTSAAPSDAD